MAQPTNVLICETVRGFSVHQDGKVYPPTSKFTELAAVLEFLKAEEIGWRFLRDVADPAVQEEASIIICRVRESRDRLARLRVPLGNIQRHIDESAFN